MSHPASNPGPAGAGSRTERDARPRVGRRPWENIKKRMINLVDYMVDLTQIPSGISRDIRVAEKVRELLVQAALAEEEFARLGTVKNLDEAIEYMTQALSLTPEGHASRSYRLWALGTFFDLRFEHLGELRDIDKAIALRTQAMPLTPDDDDVLKPSRLHNLGNSYLSRFEHLGELTDINKAIEFQTQAVTRTPDACVDKRSRLNNLGNSYQARFESFGELVDIDKAIECQTKAVALSSEGDPNRPSLLANLGSSYELRFEYLDELADIFKAIDCHNQALLLDPDNPSLLSSLGNSYLRRFEQLGELADIGEAIDCQARAVALTDDGHPYKAGRLKNLGASYRSRFERLGEVADINKAIEFNTQAVTLTPDGHAHKPGRLNSLGNSYLNRFERLGELADIDKAIECQTQAVLLTPDGHAEQPGRLGNIGNSYKARFERLGKPDDIDKAIEFHTQAVLLIPDGHGQKPSLLNNLGSSHTRRFEQLGELADIDKAIKFQEQAVTLTPDGHIDQPGWLNNLGISHQNRWERLEELADIDKAIKCHTQAVLLTPDHHADKPSMLNNLGNSYQSRFERFGEVADIDKAIEFQTQAVVLTPDGHAQKPRRLNNLGNSHFRRFELLGEPADIDRAIECQTQALVLSPNGHEQEPTLHSSLGNSYLCRFKRLGELADIDKAIECQQQAVTLTPDGYLDKPNWLINLGESYHARFDRLDDLAALERARSLWQHAAGLIVTNPETQIRCARKWAKFSPALGLSPQSAYERCMELIPHLIWLGATIDQRYYLLTEVSEIATEAAAWAISVQAYNLALEWLEEGRSIVWNQILQLRTPFDDLFSVDPVLAGQLKDIASKLERAGARQAAPTSSINNPVDLEKEAQNHHHLATQWEQHLGMARQIPGFSNFMRPRKAAELMRAAGDCPVVAINMHETRCDALIIRPSTDEIAHVPLGSFSVALAKSNREQLVSLLEHQGIRGMILRPVASEPPLSFRKVLEALWCDITKPILESLGYMQQMPIDELPRITWCTTGAASFLPLHAAGCYDGTQPTAPDLVVSSYTPTLSALLSLKPPTSSPSAGLLAVGQGEYLNDLGNLPGTVGELAAIKEHAEKIRYLQLDGGDATVDAVLNAMGEHSWVHLACHAIQNRENISLSAFHLRDGSLTLGTITKHSFKNKGLAFLSACQTATGHEKLPDEALHLAAGMLMAGYPSVIATMWSIWDIDGPEVAREVYAELLKDGKMDCKGAARALHKAVAGLRKQVGQDSFKRWVPFIHIGA